MYAIYKITNLINKHLYIGFTSQQPPEKRWKQEIRTARNGAMRRGRRCWNGYFFNALRKYGAENFSFEILKQGEDAEWGLVVEEPYYIAMYRPEYNMTAGGEGVLGYKWSREAKEKASARMTGLKKSPEWCAAISKAKRGVPAPNSNFYTSEHRQLVSQLHRGIPKSPEHRAKLSAANIGHVPTPETREKLRVANTGRIKTPEECAKISKTLKGRVFTLEHRAAISKAAKGRPGRPHTPAQKAALAAYNASKGPVSLATREKISIAKKERFKAKKLILEQACLPNLLPNQPLTPT